MSTKQEQSHTIVSGKAGPVKMYNSTCPICHGDIEPKDLTNYTLDGIHHSIHRNCALTFEHRSKFGHKK